MAYFVYEFEARGSQLHEERQGYHAQSLERANQRIVQYLRTVFGEARRGVMARLVGEWPTKDAYERSPDVPPAFRPPIRAARRDAAPPTGLARAGR